MSPRQRIFDHFLQCLDISTDTRTINDGAIFMALKGENFDGNKYADQALSAGASLAVVDNPEVVKNDSYMLVEDVLEALQNLARDYRKLLQLPIIGITGTNGKTTTKELLHSVLSTHFNCYATEGNYNNHIGVPLSVLRIKPEHEIAIIEMGANKGADIIELCEICMPTCGLITNVGYAHLEGFGSFENIKKTKKELYDFLHRADSKVFMNRDNEHLQEMGAMLKNITYYSIQSESELKGTVTAHDVTLRFSWKTSDYSSPEIKTNLTGEYNLENALAALTVGRYFDVPEEKMNQGLENYSPKNNRSQVKKTKRNTLILDAYNANITSTKEAVLNLSKIAVANEDKFFVLGDMLELGDLSKEAHQDLIQLTQSKGLSGVFIGKEYMSASDEMYVRSYSSAADFIQEMGDFQLEGKTILIKGSRGIKLEVLEEHL